MNDILFRFACVHTARIHALGDDDADIYLVSVAWSTVKIFSIAGLPPSLASSS